MGHSNWSVKIEQSCCPSSHPLPPHTHAPHRADTRCSTHHRPALKTRVSKIRVHTDPVHTEATD